MKDFIMLRIGVTASSFCKNSSLCKMLQDYFPDSSISFVEPQQDLSGDDFLSFTKNKELLLVGKKLSIKALWMLSQVLKLFLNMELVLIISI